MTLVRVYCGLASANGAGVQPAPESRLTVAVVDDAGRLLDVCEVSDDAGGYARVCALLEQRGEGVAAIAVAGPWERHHVSQLLVASGRYVTPIDADAADNHAERFGDDRSAREMAAGVAERRAIGLARALQAGALSAVAQPPPVDLVALKPVLAAHAAVVAGRQDAAAALRQVLRELYPAALCAYPDPAEAVALSVLDALPDPGELSAASAAHRERQIVATLAESGVADPATLTESVTALRIAVAETPPRADVTPAMTTAAAQTVRQLVAAVRACDLAAESLVSLLDNGLPAPGEAIAAPAIAVAREGRVVPARAVTPAQLRAVPEPVHAAPAARIPQPAARPSEPPAALDSSQPKRTPDSTDALPRRAERNAPAAGRPPFQPEPTQQRTQPAAEHTPPFGVPTVAPPPGYQPPAQHAPGWLPTTAAAPVPHSHAAPVPPRPPIPVTPAMPDPPAAATLPRPDEPPMVPDAPAPPGRIPSQVGDYEAPGADAPRLSPRVAAPGSRSGWPLLREPALPSPAGRTEPAKDRPTDGGPPEHRLPEDRGSDKPRPVGHRPAESPPDKDAHDEDRHDPDRTLTVAPIGAADLPRLIDLPRQREGRVTPPWQADDLPAEPPTLRLVEPAPLADPALSERTHTDALGDDLRLDPPPLRLVESNGESLAGLPAGREPSDVAAEPRMSDEPDGDLLIFAACRSAWFTNRDDAGDVDWSTEADLGWRAAEQAAEPSIGDETGAGLPRRVPQQNLVPGSPISAPERPLRIVRDPAAIAAHTTGYFSGYRRGQEAGGYSVGGRPGRESAGGWDFSRDPSGTERDYSSAREYEYRSANR